MEERAKWQMRSGGKVRDNDDKSLLSCVSLFSALPSEDLEEIAKRCSWRSYSGGEEILAYLDASHDVYFIVSGSAKVLIYSTQGKAVGFRDLAPGDVFGELAAIDGGTRSAGIEAAPKCGVAIMSSSDFRDLLLQYPAVSQALNLHLTQQIRSLTQRIYEFSTLAVNNRIQAELLRLARESTNDGPVGSTAPHITPAPTHAAVAARVSTHREAVTRQISSLTKNGILERKGKSLVIRDIEQLEVMVREATGE